MSVGTINLAATPVVAAPVWKLASLDAASQAYINSYAATVASAVRSGGALPADGFQDWAFDVANNRLVVYLGIDKKFTTVSNLATTPSVTTNNIPPANQLPISDDIGGMYRDPANNLYLLAAATGRVYKVDITNGNYSGTSFVSGVGFSRGDATQTPSPPPPLPVELVSFEAAATATGTVQLLWRTASEVAVARFVFERSLDGRLWTDVAEIAPSQRATGAIYYTTDGRYPRPLLPAAHGGHRRLGGVVGGAGHATRHL